MDDRDDVSRVWFNPSQVHVIADDAVLEIADEDSLIRLSGAMSGSTVTAIMTAKGISMSVKNDTVMSMVRHIEIRQDETLVRNQVFQLEPEYRGKGFGARALTVQARAAQELGFAAIELDATGDHMMATTRHERDQHIGYFIWPRLGFEAPIPAVALKRLPDKYKSCVHISELMTTVEGQDDWFIHGDTLNNARFDVSEGSRSWEFLIAYCQQRNIRI